MSILRFDLDRVWHAVEASVGANQGQNAGAWGIENVWGVGGGENQARNYYVVVNVYGSGGGSPCQVWLVALNPNTIPAWTATKQGGNYTTPALAVTAVDTLVTALGGLGSQTVNVGPIVQ